MIGPGRSGAPTQIVFDESDESGLNFLRNTLFSEYRTTDLCSWRVRGSDYDNYLSPLPRELQRPCLRKGLQDESPGPLPWLQSDKCVEGKPYSKSRRTITNTKTTRFSKLWEQSPTQ
jgi:hypothetical protein